MIKRHAQFLSFHLYELMVLQRSFFVLDQFQHGEMTMHMHIVQTF